MIKPFWGIIGRHRSQIALFGLLCGALVFFLAIVLAPRYRVRTEYSVLQDGMSYRVRVEKDAKGSILRIDTLGNDRSQTLQVSEEITRIIMQRDATAKVVSGSVAEKNPSTALLTLATALGAVLGAGLMAGASAFRNGIVLHGAMSGSTASEHEQQKENAAVLGYAFALRSRIVDGRRVITPGLSNMALMSAFFTKHKSLWHAPLLLQGELADAANALAPGMLPNGITPNVALAVREHRTPGQYLDTDEVTAQAVDFAASQGYKTLYVLAAPTIPLAHRLPAMLVARKYARPHGIRVKALKTGWIPADPLSEQPWTRSISAIWKYLFKRILLGQRGGA